MRYCAICAEDYGWSQEHPKSWAECEQCGVNSICFEAPFLMRPPMPRLKETFLRFLKGL